MLAGGVFLPFCMAGTHFPLPHLAEGYALVSPPSPGLFLALLFKGAIFDI
jgi:hypothetical protein